ncbi:hypothetical protein LTR53_002086 [Teratosphaeriaceae sp. CCFEE 6253]|nr:hypothetical protein LTR53_002086 [Teratosphaeriaceae sp. CCFEE 6253]
MASEEQSFPAGGEIADLLLEIREHVGITVSHLSEAASAFHSAKATIFLLPKSVSKTEVIEAIGRGAAADLTQTEQVLRTVDAICATVFAQRWPIEGGDALVKPHRTVERVMMNFGLLGVREEAGLVNAAEVRTEALKAVVIALDNAADETTTLRSQKMRFERSIADAEAMKSLNAEQRAFEAEERKIKLAKHVAAIEITNAKRRRRFAAATRSGNGASVEVADANSSRAGTISKPSHAGRVGKRDSSSQSQLPDAGNEAALDGEKMAIAGPPRRSKRRGQGSETTAQAAISFISSEPHDGSEVEGAHRCADAAGQSGAVGTSSQTTPPSAAPPRKRKSNEGTAPTQADKPKKKRRTVQRASIPFHPWTAKEEEALVVMFCTDVLEPDAAKRKRYSGIDARVTAFNQWLSNEGIGWQRTWASMEQHIHKMKAGNYIVTSIRERCAKDSVDDEIEPTGAAAQSPERAEDGQDTGRQAGDTVEADD